MNHFSRPYRSIGIVTIGAGAWLALASPGVRAQAAGMIEVLQDSGPMLLHSSASQGYLGVDFVDVDQEKAQSLKLKEVRGAVITLIDHDAPAGQAGMRVNDVVIQLNGQNVEGAEQLKRMLKEIPPGHKVSIEVSRDGNVQTMAVELVDHRVLGHDIWKKIGHDGDDAAPSTLGMLTGTGDASAPSVFKMPIFGSTLNVGAMVEPLTSQMADYLGVPNGLMVKQVARKSEAAAAGLKAFDVILKVGSDAISTSADWERALHANTGKPVQVTILRDRKQQTLTLQVDSKRHSELEMEEIFPGCDERMVAELEQQLAGQLGQQTEAAAEALRRQAQSLRDQMGNLQPLSSQQAEELRWMAEQMRQNFKPEDFKIDSRQMDELKRQMDEFRQNFKPEDFEIAPQQFDQLRRQMQQLKRQMEELNTQGLDGRV